MKHVVIIGNGISGITAARHIRKLSDDKITVISAESDYFYSRTALMYIYMGHMKFEHTKPYEDWFWKKNRIHLIREYVEQVDVSSSELIFSNSKTLKYDTLIIATGSKTKTYNWPGQHYTGVQGLYSLQDLELMEKNTQSTQHAVVVGGGLVGIEMAEMLNSRKINVSMLVRESSYWGSVLPNEEAQLIHRHLRKHNIDLRLNSELSQIMDDGNGKVKSVITSNGDIIECQFVGLTTGVEPNVGFLKESSIELENGILVNEYLETNVDNVYAIGDCAQFRKHPDLNRKAIEQVWYTGKIMGETVACSITGKKTAYQPGLWFNSAKFFDIEYQTYGWVWSKPKENENVFFWEHPNHEKCLKLVFDKNSGKLLGINVFGIRLRHEVCERWISNGVVIEQVLSEFKDANFDPEFYARHEEEIVAKFNRENETTIRPKKKSWKRILNLS